MESRPQVNSLSLFLQTSSPLPLPFKAEAQGNGPGDKLIFTEASPDNAATSYPPCWVWMCMKNITEECFVWIAGVMVMRLLRRMRRETVGTMSQNGKTITQTTLYYHPMTINNILIHFRMYSCRHATMLFSTVISGGLRHVCCPDKASRLIQGWKLSSHLSVRVFTSWCLLMWVTAKLTTVASVNSEELGH